MSPLISPATALQVKRSVKRGLLTLKRERGWGMSVLPLLAIALLLQLFFVAGFAAQAAQNALRATANITLQARSGAADADIQAFLVALKQQPWLRDVRYVTRESALQQARVSDPAMAEALNRVPGSNPFRDTVIVRLTDSYRYEDFVTFAQSAQWQRVLDPAGLSSITLQQQAFAADMASAAKARMLTIALSIAMAAVALFAIVELVRRRALLRRDELFVERMSGAQEASIVLPFCTEVSVMVFLALALAAAVAAGALWIVSHTLTGWESGLMALTIKETEALLLTFGPMAVVAQLLLVPFIGFAGALWGTRAK